MGEPRSFSFLAPYDESRSFAFTEDVHRLERSWNFFVSGMLQKTKMPSCISGFMFCSSFSRLPSPGMVVCSFSK